MLTNEYIFHTISVGLEANFQIIQSFKKQEAYDDIEINQKMGCM